MALDLAPNSVYFFLFTSLEVIFLIIPFIVFKMQKKSIKHEFFSRLSPQKRSKIQRIGDILFGIMFGIGFYYLSRFLSSSIYNYIISTQGLDYYIAASSGSVNTTPPSFKINELILAIIFMFVFVGLCEEYCFRGVIMKELNNKNKILGVLLNSGIFMIYHVFPGVVPLITFYTFWSYYLIFGLVLSLIVLFNKGDLLMAIIAHGTFNSIILLNIYL